MLLARPDVKPGDLVDDEEQNAGHDEGPRGTREGARELDAELTEVAVPPATVVGCAGDAIEGWDESRGEDAGQEVSDKAADPVDGEDVEAFIN